MGAALPQKFVDRFFYFFKGPEKGIIIHLLRPDLKPLVDPDQMGGGKKADPVSAFYQHGAEIGAHASFSVSPGYMNDFFSIFRMTELVQQTVCMLQRSIRRKLTDSFNIIDRFLVCHFPLPRIFSLVPSGKPDA